MVHFILMQKNILGTDERGADAVAKLHFPGIDPDAAEWLVKNRKIKAVGLDVASVDYGQSKDFKTHQILYEQNIPGFENVANLDKLPVKGAFIIALPMKIKGGSGAPLRIVAIVPGRKIILFIWQIIFYTIRSVDLRIILLSYILLLTVRQ